MPDPLTVTRTAAGLAVVTLDRPPVNAFDLPLTQHLERLPDELADAPAIVVAGRAPHFSAGLDLKALRTYDAAQRDTLMHAIDRVARRWYLHPRPVVAAVTGHAMAGGLLIAMCADLRVVTDAPVARFGLPAVRVGVEYPEGPWQVLTDQLGNPARRRLLVAGERIDAATAVRLGLFDEAVAPEQVVPRAIARAEDLATVPAEGFRRVKLRVRSTWPVQ